MEDAGFFFELKCHFAGTILFLLRLPQVHVYKGPDSAAASCTVLHCQEAFHKNKAAAELYLTIVFTHRRKIFVCVRLVEVKTKVGSKVDCSSLRSEVILPIVLSLCTAH